MGRYRTDLAFAQIAVEEEDERETEHGKRRSLHGRNMCHQNTFDKEHHTFVICERQDKTAQDITTQHNTKQGKTK